MSKDISRVKYYKIGSNDWDAEYNMLLDDGITCLNCRNCIKCCSMFGQKETDTKCQFYPNKFENSRKIILENCCEIAQKDAFNSALELASKCIQ